MTTNSSSYSSNNWRTFLQSLWKGNEKPSHWFVRILLTFILYQIINWLWQNSLSIARWTQPSKSFSLVFVAVTILVAIWMILTAWRLLSTLGGRGATILLVAWYTIAVCARLLTLPPGQPVLSSLREQMAIVAKEGMLIIPRSINNLPKAINDFRFAYIRQRNLIDLPNIDEPDKPLAGSLIDPNYIAVLETSTPVRTPEIKPVEIIPIVPTKMSDTELEYIESTSTSPSTQSGLSIGAFVTIADTNGKPLRAHITPGVDSEITARFPEGSQVLLLDGPVVEGDFIWWLVEGNNGKGWCAESFLESSVNGN